MKGLCFAKIAQVQVPILQVRPADFIVGKLPLRSEILHIAACLPLMRTSYLVDPRGD
jgi:hypothetical protein